jgi:glutamine amidotransferase-like uncharacterized protein
VFRGPATCLGCAEAVAAVLATASEGFEVHYIGPNEDIQLTADALAGAALFAQPGSALSVDDYFNTMAGCATTIDAYVHGGGRYLGFADGGYLAGKNPGYEMLPGDSNSYITSAGATVTDPQDTVIKITWRGQPRYVYFQDGPIFLIDPGTAGVTTLANYDNGTVAAVVTPFGAGKVGVVGPHPEADLSWYSYYGLVDPDGPDPDLAHDLIDTLMQ